MPADEHTQNQRSQVGLQTYDFECIGSPHGQEQSQQDEQLAMATSIDHGHDQRPNQEETDQKERPRRGKLAGGEGEKQDRDQVLHDQDANRDACVQGGHFSLFFQDLDREDRAGKAQCKREHQRSSEIQSAEHAEATEAEPVDPESEADHGDEHVQRRPRPHLRPQQALDPELQPDAE